MSAFYLGLTLFLILNVMAGLVRAVRGPTRADRILAAQLFATTWVAILLVVAQSEGIPALRDVALVLSLLAVVVTAAFVRVFGSKERKRT